MFGITSAGLNKDIESAVSMFTKAVNKLDETVLKAKEAKAQKEEEIKNLQTECNALDETTNKATNMANKIRSLIS
jgi:prefoldin subunit 5